VKKISLAASFEDLQSLMSH